jgi:citrate lyase beta subunit
MPATSLSDSAYAAALGALTKPNRRFAEDYPGERGERQPLHTVYGGAQLFKSSTPRKLGELALTHLREYAPDARTLAEAVDLPGGASLAEAVYSRVVQKLEREPVEDFRIDFEDGFGIRPDAEEDAEAERTAGEVAIGMREGTLPPFLGIRVKTLSEELKGRAIRTLDIFLTTLVKQTGGKLPSGFVVTLPKITGVEQVKSFAGVLKHLERALDLPAHALKMEMMIELTQTLVDRRGRVQLPRLARAAKGRCVGAHFGTYDYTASCSITAAHQHMAHPACDFAKHMMQVAFSSTGINLSDGATNVMPAPPHKGANLTDAQRNENIRVVHAAWKLAFGHIRHSLEGGFYQGWDLHPGQLPIRYAAAFSFFLEGLEPASARLSNFIGKAAQATLVGDVFDDAATGQGLLNYFLRAWSCGAIGDSEIAKTGLTLEEIQGRSFLKILERRRKL